jgi:hypothetical protein
MAASSPGRGEDLGPQACDEAADITYLTVGFWRRSAKPAPLSFLVLHSSEKFVLLAEEPWSGQQVSSSAVVRPVSLAHPETVLDSSYTPLAGPFTEVVQDCEAAECKEPIQDFFLSRWQLFGGGL